MFEFLGAFDPVVVRVAGAAGFIGLVCVLAGLFRDRARGRLRCPKCWFDMSGHAIEEASAIVCPECGKCVRKRKQLQRTRRRRWIACVGALFLASGMCAPKVNRDGWHSILPMSILTFLDSDAGIEWVDAEFHGNPIYHWIGIEVNRRIDSDQMTSSAWQCWMEHVNDELLVAGKSFHDPAIRALHERLEFETLTFHWDEDVFEQLERSTQIRIRPNFQVGWSTDLHLHGELTIAEALHFLDRWMGPRFQSDLVQISYAGEHAELGTAPIGPASIGHHRIAIFDLDAIQRLIRERGGATSTDPSAVHWIYTNDHLTRLSAYWVVKLNQGFYQNSPIRIYDKRWLMIAASPPGLIEMERFYDSVLSALQRGSDSSGVHAVRNVRERWDRVRHTPMTPNPEAPRAMLREFALEYDGAMTADLSCSLGHQHTPEWGFAGAATSLGEYASHALSHNKYSSKLAAGETGNALHIGAFYPQDRHAILYELGHILDQVQLIDCWERLSFHLHWSTATQPMSNDTPDATIETDAVDALPAAGTRQRSIRAIDSVVSALVQDNWFDEAFETSVNVTILDDAMLVAATTQQHFLVDDFFQHLNDLAAGHVHADPISRSERKPSEDVFAPQLHCFDLSRVFSSQSNFATARSIEVGLADALYHASPGSKFPCVLANNGNQTVLIALVNSYALSLFNDLIQRWEKVIDNGDSDERALRRAHSDSRSTCLSLYDLRKCKQLAGASPSSIREYLSESTVLSRLLQAGQRARLQNDEWAVLAGSILIVSAQGSEHIAIETWIDSLSTPMMAQHP